jgi:hypothetical protein
MLSYGVSVIITSAYALVGFIRNSSQTGVLVTLGSLFFVSGTVLRRHLRAGLEPTSWHLSLIRERSIPLHTYPGAPYAVADALPVTGQATVSQPSVIWEPLTLLNTYVGAGEGVAGAAASRKHANAV